MNIKQLSLFVLASRLAIAGVVNAQVYVIDGTSYVSASATENINVGSWGPQTAESENEYTGYILMSVSGYWNPFGLEPNPELGLFDGFYYFGNTPGSTGHRLGDS